MATKIVLSSGEALRKVQIAAMVERSKIMLHKLTQPIDMFPEYKDSYGSLNFYGPIIWGKAATACKVSSPRRGFDVRRN